MASHRKETLVKRRRSSLRGHGFQLPCGHGGRQHSDPAQASAGRPPGQEGERDRGLALCPLPGSELRGLCLGRAPRPGAGRGPRRRCRAREAGAGRRRGGACHLVLQAPGGTAHAAKRREPGRPRDIRTAVLMLSPRPPPTLALRASPPPKTPAGNQSRVAPGSRTQWFPRRGRSKLGVGWRQVYEAPRAGL